MLKKLLFTIIAFVIFNKTVVNAQVYTINNATDTTCSGNFYDTGGSGSGYGNYQDLTHTFLSGNGNRISFNFAYLNTEAGYDYLNIYDGPSSAYPLIGSYTGSNNPGVVTSSGTALTFYFHSDNTGTGSGWDATISCTTPVLTVYNLNDTSVTTCSGVFYDSQGGGSNYLINENKVMTFCSGTTQSIQAQLTNFNLATDDTLFVYDGGSVSGNPIGAYTGGNLPEVIYSKISTCLTFKFVSNGVNQSTGWQANISCISTPPVQNYILQQGIRYTCGGNFFDIGGNTGGYGNYQDITETFISDNGNRISMNFSYFNTEAGYDYLNIYDGPSSAYPLIGTYSGGNNPGLITSTGTSLTFYFHSDNINTGDGWVAGIACTTAVLTPYLLSNTNVTTCSGVFYDSQGGGANYLINENKVMTFCSGSSQFLQAQFTNFNLALDDTLFVYDGNSVGGNPVGAYTGSSLPEIIYSKISTCLTFKFVSNGVNQAAGWKALITCDTNPPVQNFNIQQGVRYTCGGNFFDTGGNTGGYGNYQDITETFISDNGNRISMNFSYFNTEAGYDYMNIYDGPSSAYPLIGTYSGGNNPGLITSTGTSLTFYFHSDNINTGGGWVAAVACTTAVLTPYLISNTNVTTCSGVFYDSQGGGSNYLINENKVMTFWSGSSQFLQVQFTNFNLALDDTLFVYDGTGIGGIPTGAYTGSSLPEIIYSKTTNCLTFQFISNGVNQAAGWKALITCDTNPPIQNYNIQQGVRYTCGGNFFDTGCNTAGYGNYQDITETFISDNGNRISMNFSYFNTEAGYDYLNIYDGPSSAYPLIGTFSGGNNPGTITSTGTSLTFYFHSDNINTGGGWVAGISCTTPPLPYFNLTNGQTVNVCEGVFFDDGGPAANYLNNGNKVMTFCSPTNEYLQFNFTNYNFAINNEDSLFVYDGNSISDPLLAILTGGATPGTITSNGTCLTFRFKTDAVNNNIGWKAIFNCVSVPDTAPVYNMTGGVRYTCSGTFYDGGGINGGYGNYEDRVMSFYSNSGCGIRFDFTYFNTESGYDYLRVYDGPNTSSPVLATYSGGSIPPPVQSTGNVITFYFHSDNITTGGGWAATASCPNQPLALITTSGPTNFCYGDSVILTSTLNSSYSWNTGATTQSIIVTGSAGFQVIVTNANGCTATSPLVTVNAGVELYAPVVSQSGPTTFCDGGSVWLSAYTGIAPVTFHWSNGSTNANLFADQTGVYTVYFTDSLGCSSDYTTINVVKNPLPIVTLVFATDTVCINTPIFNLTGGSPAGGSYSGTGVSNYQFDANVAGLGTHTITYAYTDGNGCTNIATRNITVVNEPTASVTASGTTVFCTGGSVTLTATGGNYFLWSNGSTGNQLVVTQSGTYTVTVSNGGSCTAVSNPTTVIANPLPNVTLAMPQDTFCIISGSINLSGGNPLGGTYSGPGVTGTIFNPATAGIGLHNITYSYTDGNGCSNLATQTVFVGSAPTVNVNASGPLTFCAGNSVILTATGGATYLWSNGSTNAVIIITTAGTYTVTVTDAGGCSSSSNSVTVVVNPLPTVTVTLPLDTFCLNGATVTLSGGAPAGGTYSGNGVNGNQFNPALAGTGNHLITYSYTDGNNCSNTATQNIYVTVCSGINNINGEEEIVAYPNPTTDQLTVKWTSTLKCKSLVLKDVAGRIVAEFSIQNATQHNIDMSNYESGVYFITLNGTSSPTLMITKE